MRSLLLFLILGLWCCHANAQSSEECACCTAEYEAFDFWLGDWDVYDAAGKFAGSNQIRKVQNNCVLQENWTSATPGFTGTSYNFYNKRIDRWEQIWIDNSGVSLHLVGNIQGNQMVLKTKPIPNKQNQLFYSQITWTKNDDGTVRQLWQVFTEGQEALVAFDGLYRPKE